jgi:hypothetical protein
MKSINLLLLWLAGVLGAAIIGALTNTINGQVSPLYFVTILGWESVDQVSRAAVAQGIYEGMLTGLLFSTLFAASLGVISRLKCPISDGLRYLGYLLLTTLITWCLGGTIAVGLAFLSPEFYQNAFYGVPEPIDLMLRYAWVGGSIWGVQLGGFGALVLWVIIFWANWQSSWRSQGKL